MKIVIAIFKSSNDIDINFEPLSNFDKKNTMTSNNNSDVMLENYDIIINLVSFSCFGVIQKLNFEQMCIINKFLLISTLHLTKVERRTRKSLMHGLHYRFENKHIFWENAQYLQKKW